MLDAVVHNNFRWWGNIFRKLHRKLRHQPRRRLVDQPQSFRLRLVQLPGHQQLRLYRLKV